MDNLNPLKTGDADDRNSKIGWFIFLLVAGIGVLYLIFGATNTAPYFYAHRAPGIFRFLGFLTVVAGWGSGYMAALKESKIWGGVAIALIFLALFVAAGFNIDTLGAPEFK